MTKILLDNFGCEPAKSDDCACSYRETDEIVPPETLEQPNDQGNQTLEATTRGR